MAKSVTFIDTEVGVDDHKIHDIGAIRQDRASFHAANIREFAAFVEGTEYILSLIHIYGKICLDSIAIFEGLW